MKHLPILDGLRGWAILGVMVYHFSIPFQQLAAPNILDSVFGKLFQAGWIGVDLFFVMSGFLITSILQTNLSSDGYYKNFYMRRFLRIFPLYYAVLLMLLLILPTISDSFSEQTKNMQENAFWFWSYLVNWKIAMEGTFGTIQGGYMWSLAVEEQFYIVWPFFIKKLRQHLESAIILMFLSSLLLKVALFLNDYSGTTIYTLTFTHIDGLLLGSFLAILRIKGKLSNPHSKALKSLLVFSLLCTIGISCYAGGLIFYNSLVATFGVSLVSIAFCILLYYLLEDKTPLNFRKLFELQPILYCGKLCYGLYLLHQPIGIAVQKVIVNPLGFSVGSSYLPATLLSMLISLLVSLVAAQLSYSLFELQFLKLKKYFA